MPKAATSEFQRLTMAALSKPFSEVPLELEFVLAERSITLGEVSALAIGDVLKFEGADPSNLQLIVGGAAIGRARSQETQPARVEITGWQEKD